jgi:hypothetical protein
VRIHQKFPNSTKFLPELVEVCSLEAEREIRYHTT